MKDVFIGRITKFYLPTKKTAYPYFILHSNQDKRGIRFRFDKEDKQLFLKIPKWLNRVVEVKADLSRGVNEAYQEHPIMFLAEVKRVEVGKKNDAPASPEKPFSSLVENSLSLHYSTHARERIKQRDAKLTIDQTRNMERITAKAQTHKHSEILIFVNQKYIYAISVPNKVVTTVMNIGMLRWEDGMISTENVDALYFID